MNELLDNAYRLMTAEALWDIGTAEPKPDTAASEPTPRSRDEDVPLFI